MFSKELSMVIKALKQLSNEPDEQEDEDDYDSDDSSNFEDISKSSDDSMESQQSYFYVEDIIPSEHFKLNVKAVGELKFPIDNETIQKLLKISSKAKFGKGESTVLDTNFRDTQMIPANKLKINIKESALTEVLDRVSKGLNIDKKSTLSIHLHNLLIYGPGQFFKEHRDSEKLPNMVASLVIVLPTQHEGGDLIIDHGGIKHVFFGSKQSIKCIAFYADCRHKVQKVTEGYRVALTYNVVVKYSPILSKIKVNKSLHSAVSNYFDSTGNYLLVYLLNHMYTENGLRWQVLKGTDRTRAQALFAVAKKQGRKPFLALAKYHVYTDAEYSDNDDEGGQTSLYFWINEINLKVEVSRSQLKSKYSYMRSQDVDVSDDEICFTVKTDTMCEPYKTEDGGPTGNEGHPIEHWYRRACVAIWANENSFSTKMDSSVPSKRQRLQ